MNDPTLLFAVVAIQQGLFAVSWIVIRALNIAPRGGATCWIVATLLFGAA